LGATVYVVDNDYSFRVAIGRLLRLADYDVEEYASADDLLPTLPAGIAASCILPFDGRDVLTQYSRRRPFPLVLRSC
jgi:FixJ family two-component response regulator